MSKCICGEELTKQKNGKNRCLKCYPVLPAARKTKKQIAAEKKVKGKGSYLTEEDVRVIVIDEIANWMTPEIGKAIDDSTPDGEPAWRDEARQYGISMYQKKKADVLVEIEAAKAEIKET